MTDAERILRVDAVLRGLYPEVPVLRFNSPFSLLVAAVLAAQCTDERVNRVTESLFEAFPDPAAFADAPIEALEEAVRSTGYFHQKARTLKACSRALVERFGGDVPRDLESLTSLPGIGRKTANLVLGSSMGLAAVFVDTHVKRVSYRLGFTRHTDPDKIEADLVSLLPPPRRTPFSNLLTHHGRAFCTARRPRCEECPLRELSPKIGVDQAGRR